MKTVADANWKSSQLNSQNKEQNVTFVFTLDGERHGHGELAYCGAAELNGPQSSFDWREVRVEKREHA